MKTLDQIYRYTSDCKFSNKDWQMVLDYCRDKYRGGKIHRSMNPKSSSTYEQFVEWIDNGFGPGDFISYGKTMGIVGSSTPDYISLALYCDYDGNLIVNNMEVMEPERLKPLDNDRCEQLKKLMFDNQVEYNVRFGMAGKLYTPQKNSCIIINDDRYVVPHVGMYLKSEGCKHYFEVILFGDEVKFDCWIDAGYTPLKPAPMDDLKRMCRAITNAGYSYNERLQKYVKLEKKVKSNHYWYMNDRFEIVSDIDNGAKKHTERFNAGNYFVDQTKALLFLKDVMRLVEK